MRISVIGLGKLGLPFASLLAKAGHRVVGLDLNIKRLEDIRSFRIESEPEVASLVRDELNRNLIITSDWKSALNKSEISFVIVPTPSGEDGKFKNDYVIESILHVLEYVDLRDHIVCIVSTVMPGTCAKVLTPLIEQNQRVRDLNIELAYSPEFIALGTIVKNMKNPDMILIGENQAWVGDKLISVLTSVSKNSPKICRMSPTSAELAKLAVNTFVTSKISYANMIAEIADALDDVDKYQVLDAVGSDSRVGGKYLRPGLGFGGPCFPRDNRAIGSLADSLGVGAELAKATEAINLRQPHIQLTKVIRKIGAEPRKILFLGLSYKPGSYVTEESQALQIAALLSEKGNLVHVHDPLATLPAELLNDGGLRQIPQLLELQTYDYIVLAVDWPDYELVKSTVESNRLIRIS